MTRTDQNQGRNTAKPVGNLVPLPEVIPVFPLSGAVLLPRNELPLNIFEPRYLDMVRDAMGGTRIIGMIQPSQNDRLADKPALYDIGCAGRITAFKETEDGRFLITLQGISRFRVVEELDCTTRYRQVRADYGEFVDDRRIPAERADVDRTGLEERLRRYLDQLGLAADWKAFHAASDERLVNSLAVICPFEASEKQALLEADSLSRRAQTMMALMDFSVAEGDNGIRPQH